MRNLEGNKRKVGPDYIHTFRIPNKMYTKVSLRDAVVYAVIKKHADIRKWDFSCFPSQDLIKGGVGCCKPSVVKSITNLIDNRYLNMDGDGRKHYYKFNRLQNRYEVCSETFAFSKELTYDEKGYILFSLELMDLSVSGKGVLDKSTKELAQLFRITLNAAKKIEASLIEKGFITEIREVIGVRYMTFDLGRVDLNMKGKKHLKDKVSKEAYVAEIEALRKDKKEDDRHFEKTMKEIASLRKHTSEENKDVEAASIKVAVPHDMHKELTFQDTLVFSFIKTYKNKATNMCYPSLRTLSRRTGFDIEAVRGSINKLLQNGCMALVKEDGKTYYSFENLKDNFEVITSNFLNNKDLTNNEKGYIIAISQHLFRDIAGWGKTSYTLEERAKLLGAKTWQVMGVEDSLKRKGYIIPLALKKYEHMYNRVLKKETKVETAVMRTEELVFNLSKLHLNTPSKKVHVDTKSSFMVLKKELKRAAKEAHDARKSVELAKRQLRFLKEMGVSSISGRFVNVLFAA